MDFSVFDEFFESIDGIGDLISLVASFFEGFPKIFTSAWSWIIILIILAGVFSIIWHSLS